MMAETVTVPFIGGGLDGQTMAVAKPLLNTMRDVEGTIYRLVLFKDGSRVYMEESQAYEALKEADRRLG
jgi:hypothetical protein